MSKELDYDNLSEDDKAWLRSRGWGYRIPGEVQANKDEGVVLDPNATLQEQLEAVPNYGTATVAPGTMPMEGDGDDDGDEGYDGWTVKELKTEISNRNESRDADSQLSSEGKKDDLIATLEADDKANGNDGSGE